MNSNDSELEERVRHLELLVLFMQSEISKLRNLVKRSTAQDVVRSMCASRFKTTLDELSQVPLFEFLAFFVAKEKRPRPQAGCE